MKYRQTGEYNEIAVRAELVPLSSFPALKIGKLAVSTLHKEFHPNVALAIAESLDEFGVACRFLTVDADVEYNPDTHVFYELNGFVRNEKYARRTKTISMRYDILDY